MMIVAQLGFLYVPVSGMEVYYFLAIRGCARYLDDLFPIRNTHYKKIFFVVPVPVCILGVLMLSVVIEAYEFKEKWVLQVYQVQPGVRTGRFVRKVCQ